uniref:Uncharacterized protein n=1 Tax=Anguilla anguilla TaxID=7936 RepID=A0A0E9SHJ7_ANGAN
MCHLREREDLEAKLLVQTHKFLIRLLLSFTQDITHCTTTFLSRHLFRVIIIHSNAAKLWSNTATFGEG